MLSLCKKCKFLGSRCHRRALRASRQPSHTPSFLVRRDGGTQRWSLSLCYLSAGQVRAGPTWLSAGHSIIVASWSCGGSFLCRRLPCVVDICPRLSVCPFCSRRDRRQLAVSHLRLPEWRLARLTAHSHCERSFISSVRFVSSPIRLAPHSTPKDALPQQPAFSAGRHRNTPSLPCNSRPVFRILQKLLSLQPIMGLDCFHCCGWIWLSLAQSHCRWPFWRLDIVCLLQSSLSLWSSTASVPSSPPVSNRCGHRKSKLR